jgi:uncharacterized membrane protein
MAKEPKRGPVSQQAAERPQWVAPPRWSTWVLGAAAVAGIVLASVSTWVHHEVTHSSTGFSSFCNLNATINCDTVVTSPYGVLLGVPVSVWAVGFYGALLLLTLRVALAPCVVGYAEIASRLAARPGACAVTNPYHVWIEEYAGAPYQEVAASAREHLNRLASLYLTPARESELIAVFKEATRLEADFWEMGWRAGLRGA